jgi:hypothetical protein
MTFQLGLGLGGISEESNNLLRDVVKLLESTGERLVEVFGEVGISLLDGIVKDEEVRSHLHNELVCIFCFIHCER